MSKKMKLYLFSILMIVSASFALDQITKQVVQNNLRVWESPSDLKQYYGKNIPVFRIGSLEEDTREFFIEFNFDYVRNQGAAWGFLSDLDDRVRVPFFHLITLFAVVLLFLYFRSTPPHRRIARLGLVLVLSGAVGNFFDRITLGYVIDFLDFRWNIPLPFPIQFSMSFWPHALDFLNFHFYAESWRYHFPNFNWADSAITIGVSLLVIDMLFFDSADQHPTEVESSTKIVDTIAVKNKFV